MRLDIDRIVKDALGEISTSSLVEQLESVRSKFLGKKGELTALLIWARREQAGWT